MNKQKAYLVNIDKVNKPTKTFIVNGVQQTIQESNYVISCPHCGRVIFEFPKEYNDKIKVINEINSQEKELLNIATYCASCGTKLTYKREILENK